MKSSTNTNSNVEKPALKYRPDIDGLRAIAVIAVIVFHTFPKYMRGGFIGVDVFFVISGFLISSIIFENLDGHSFSFIEFYKRRIRRIFPALIIVLLACFSFGWYVLLANEFQQLGKHIAAGAGFVSNLVLWGEAGYFDTSAETKPLLHLWSLGIEEQFYIFWPLLLWFVWKHKYRPLRIIIFIAIASFCFNLYEINKDSVATFYSPLTRFWELLCGSILAWISLYKTKEIAKTRAKLNGLLRVILFRRLSDDSNVLANIISFTGLLLLVYGFWRLHKTMTFPGKWAVVPVLGAVLIIAAGPGAWFNRKVLSHKALVWIGLISFPLYLWHWPLISFAQILDDGYTNEIARVCVIAVAFLLAWLTYRFIERPLRFSGHNTAKVICLMVLMAIVGAMGFYTYHEKGFNLRANESNNVVTGNIAAQSTKIVEYECGKQIPELQSYKFIGGCKLSKNAPPEIAFVGDSHTMHYKKSLWKKLNDEYLLMIAQPACFPVSSDRFLVGECKRKYDAVNEYLQNSPSIKTVVLSGYWNYLMAGGSKENEEGWVQVDPLTEEAVKSFKKNALSMISGLMKSKKRVVFIKDNPDIDFNIKNCFNNRPFRISSSLRRECSIGSQDFRERVAAYDAVIDEILRDFPSIEVYDTRSFFCKDGRCNASDGQLPYYADSNHLTTYGADKVVDDMLKKGYFNRH